MTDMVLISREDLQQALEALISFTRSDYIKRQHPKRYANAREVIEKHGDQQ